LRWPPGLQFIFAFASTLGRQAINTIRRQATEEKLPLFLDYPHPAYGVTQAFTSGKDVVHSAIMTVLKAALGRVADSNERNKDWPIVDLIFPVIVTDARLFEYYLDGDGNGVLGEVSESLLIWRNPSLGPQILSSRSYRGRGWMRSCSDQRRRQIQSWRDLQACLSNWERTGTQRRRHASVGERRQRRQRSIIAQPYTNARGRRRVGEAHIDRGDARELPIGGFDVPLSPLVGQLARHVCDGCRL
jgi:hypothetical protein